MRNDHANATAEAIVAAFDGLAYPIERERVADHIVEYASVRRFIAELFARYRSDGCTEVLEACKKILEEDERD